MDESALRKRLDAALVLLFANFLLLLQLTFGAGPETGFAVLVSVAGLSYALFSPSSGAGDSSSE